MTIKKTIGEKVFNVFNIIFMVLLAVVCIYPILYVLFASVSEPLLLTQHRGIIWMPLGFTLKGYEMVFRNPNVLTGYWNTIQYVVFGTVANLIMTSMGAYALSRKKALLTNFMMFIITFTMFFSGGLIPSYLLMQKLHLINKKSAMILPGLISTWNLIVMRTSFQALPDSLEESAKIDGANDFIILFRIVLPLSKALLAVMALFYAVGHWNSWFNAMLYLRKRNLYPLQLILREILITEDTSSMQLAQSGGDMMNENIYRALIQYSTIIVATVPILCIYPFLQKYFVEGVMIGAIKE